MITLQGEFELDEYWQEVLQAGNDRLADSGLDDWFVTVRPLEGADGRSAEAPRDELAVNVSAARKVLEIAVDEKPELPPDSFVQTSIIDVIDQALASLGEATGEDWTRDEGGEG